MKIEGHLNHQKIKKIIKTKEISSGSQTLRNVMPPEKIAKRKRVLKIKCFCLLNFKLRERRTINKVVKRK